MCSLLTTKTEYVSYNIADLKLHIHTSSQFLSQQKITFPHNADKQQCTVLQYKYRQQEALV